MNSETLAASGSFIEKVGFPAALVLVLLFGIFWIVKHFIADGKEARKEHREERQEWRESNKEERDESSQMMTKSLERLEQALRDTARQDR